MALALSAAFMPNTRTNLLLDGSYAPEGIDLMTTPCHAPELFWRQLAFADFDVSEMSISSLAVALSHGDRTWVALPIFAQRHFFHSAIQVRRGAGIAAPADLKGKRVGVPEYQQTGAVWCRGVLADEFGVDARDIEWYMERRPNQSHGGATGFTPPPGVRLNYIPESSNIGAMLVEGTLDATLLYIPNFVKANENLVDRSSVDISAVTQPLFPSPAAEAHRYFRATGIYPINHCAVVRRRIVEQHPWVAANLTAAFERVLAGLARRRASLLGPLAETGVLDARTASGVADEIMLCGVEPNRRILETVLRYVHEQGLSSRAVAVEELFAPGG